MEYGITCITIKDHTVIVGCSDSKLRIYDTNIHEYIMTLQGHIQMITCVTILHDFIISGSMDKTIKIWDEGECVNTLQGHKYAVNCITVLSDIQIISGSDDKTLRVWNIPSGLCTVKIKTGSNILCMILFKGNIITGDTNGSIKTWNLKTGKYTSIKHNNQKICCMTQLFNNNIAFCVSPSRSIGITDLKTEEFIEHTHVIYCIISIGDVIVTLDFIGIINIWKDKCLIQSYNIGSAIWCGCASHNSFIVGTREGKLLFFNI